MFKKKNQPEITVVATFPGMTEDKSIQPVPAHKFYPAWWKNMPTDLPWTESKYRLRGTAKVCPSFVHWFSKGIIIPAWCDMSFNYDTKTQTWTWTAGRNSPYSVDVHYNDQFLDYTDFLNKGLKADFIFKLICPWRIITSEGWSVLQVPLFYHNEQEWSILPGIIDTDVQHQINQQVVYYGKGKEIVIPKGAPLAHYMPFERSKTTLEVRDETPEDKRRFEAASNRIESQFRHGYRDAHKIP